MAFFMNMRAFILCGLTSCSITMLAADSGETGILEHNWQELKSRHLRLVPVPKRINFAETPVVIAGSGAQPVAIVLKNDTEGGRIAAAEITSRITELAPGVKVPVGGTAPSGAYVITIDNANPHLPAPPEGARNCEQTYSLTTDKNGITLAGQGETGMLYAAVTLRWLIERDGDRIMLYPATVYDWPDFTTRAVPELGQHTMPCYNQEYPSDPQKAFEKMKPVIDYIFRMKGNCLMHTNTTWQKFSPYTAKAAFNANELAATKLINDYARKRGISSFNYGKVSLGEDWRDANRPETKEMLYYKVHGEYHSWARHDLHRKKAEQIAQFSKDAGNTAFYIHAVDGGSIDNPEMWNDRDALTKQKYGNDRVSADADMFNIYIEAFKRAGVNAWLVVYPYTGTYLNEDAGLRTVGLSDTPEQRAYVRKAIDSNKQWMQAVNKRISLNVPVCLRESSQAMMFDFMNQFPGRPMFIYYEVTNPLWDVRPLLPPEIATFTTAYDPARKNDILWCNMYGGGENIAVESVFGAIGEYAWNTSFPGAHQLDRGSKEVGGRLLSFEEIYGYDQKIQDIMAERAAVAMWGDEAGQYMKELFRYNFSFAAAADPHKAAVNFKDFARLSRAMSDAGGKAVKSMDELWAKVKAAKAAGRPVMDSFSYPYFVHLYSIVKAAKAFADVNCKIEEATALLQSGDCEKAKIAIAEARQKLIDGKAEYAATMRELAGEPGIVKFDKLHPWLQNFPGISLMKPDFAVLEKKIVALDANKETIFQQFNVPAWFKTMITSRTINASQTGEPVVIDGMLNDSVWKKAGPVEHFVAWKSMKSTDNGAAAFTAYDNDNLYLGFTARQPLTAQLNEPKRGLAEYAFTEQAEWFIQPDKNKDEVYQIAVDTAGNVFTNKYKGPNGKTGVDLDLRAAAVKTASGWSAEIAIPFAKLGKRPDNNWYAMVVYDSIKSLSPRQVENYSCVFFDGKPYLTPSLYPSLKFSAASPVAIPPPELLITKSSMESKTHANGAGSFISFDPKFESRRPLYDVNVTMRLVDGDKKQVHESVIYSAPFMPLQWSPAAPINMQLDKIYSVLNMELTASFTTVDGKPGKIVATSILGDAGKLIKAEDVYAAGAAAGASGIAVPCYFDTMADGEPLLDLKQGTIEFWIKLTEAAKVPESEWKGQPRRVFLYCGPLRPDHPEATNFNCLAIIQEKRWGNLVFSIANDDYKCRQVSAGSTENWKAGEWHHVAAVWNMNANGKTMMNIYIDGNLSSKEVMEWGKPNEASLPLKPVNFAAQLGAMNSGEYPADAVIDNLNISTKLLYGASFKPERQQLNPVAGLGFSFDKSLDGKYQINGKSGIIQAKIGVLMKK